MKKKFSLIAANTPFNNSKLIYETSSIFSNLEIGKFILVPLGKKNISGCVIEKDLRDLDGLDEKKIKSAIAVVEDSYSLDEEEVKFLKWVSMYYHYPLGMLIKDVVPKFLKKPRSVKSLIGKGREITFNLNKTQVQCVNKIKSFLGQGFSKWLLHGVTGSGKTAVYFEIIKKVLDRGQSVLFLLPEINLTPQFLKFFQEHLPTKLYCYSSALNNSEKLHIWKELKSDHDPKVLLGVRSSVFLPFKRLGLIIVDEEHDHSYKQEERCPYNARDIAIKKAHSLDIPIVLGTATPSMETYYNFSKSLEDKKFYLKMEERVGGAYFPKINIMNSSSKKEQLQFFNSLWPFNEESIKKIEKAVEKGEQVLVFVNRLGFAKYIQCHSCGKQFECPNCSVNLKLFHSKNVLSCRYCEMSFPIPSNCDVCGNSQLIQRGFGTEKCEQVLKSCFPSRRVSRFDRDELRTFSQIEGRLRDFHSGNIDIFVGTQMLSKGHNFEKVNLVVVLGVDSMLSSSDYRAHEKIYQQVKQISGRSGRYSKESEVCILTSNPGHNIFKFLKDNSLIDFYREEIKVRKNLSCTPYSKFVNLSFTSKNREKVVEDVYFALSILESLRDNYFDSVKIFKPRAHIIEKLVNNYNWNITLSGKKPSDLHNIINSLALNLKKNNLQFKIDIDPSYIN